MVCEDWERISDVDVDVEERVFGEEADRIYAVVSQGLVLLLTMSE